MYTQEDLSRASQEAHRALWGAAICLIAGFVAFVAALIWRVKPLAYLGLMVGGVLFYFFYAMKVTPLAKYRRFLAELLTGLRRSQVMVFDSVSASSRMTEDGVQVYDLQMKADTGEDCLFYFDEAKPLPALAKGQRVSVESCGRYVVALRAA